MNPIFHEHLLSSIIATNYVLSKQQPDDVFTKALGSRQFHDPLAKLGVLKSQSSLSNLKEGNKG